MKRFITAKTATVIGFILAVLTFGPTQTHASLTIVGTDGAGNRLIYDSDLNITWYDAPPAWLTYNEAVAWAQNLNIGGVTGWRLPTSLNQDGSGPCSRYNCTGSEMGHLYYVALGNLGYRAPDGSYPQPGWGLKNYAPFVNIASFYNQPAERHADYWSSTTWAPDPTYAWYFEFRGGDQVAGPDFLFGEFNALAVHDGNVGNPVPIPGAVWLLGSGLIGLVAARRRFKK